MAAGRKPGSTPKANRSQTADTQARRTSSPPAKKAASGRAGTKDSYAAAKTYFADERKKPSQNRRMSGETPNQYRIKK